MQIDLTPTEERNSATVRQMIAYLNAHNVAGMLTCFDEEMEWLDVPMEASYRGKSEISRFLDSLFDAFPDLDYRLTHMVTRGDSVVAQRVSAPASPVTSECRTSGGRAKL